MTIVAVAGASPRVEVHPEGKERRILNKKTENKGQG